VVPIASPCVLWRCALLSPIVGGIGAVCGLATPLLRRGAGAHAQFALPVDKTHKVQACLCVVICPYLCQDSHIGKERMSQPVGGNKMKTKQVGNVKVTLCLTEEEGLCIQDGGKWLLMCETHGGIVQGTNKSRLWGWSNMPTEWCDGCKHAKVVA